MRPTRSRLRAASNKGGNRRDRAARGELAPLSPRALKRTCLGQAISRINKLLVRLIRGKSWQHPQQTGQDFPRNSHPKPKPERRILIREAFSSSTGKKGSV